MPKVIWVLVNSNSKQEADNIGKSLLKERMIACYGLIPRLKSVYFWPPQSHRLEQTKGPLLVLETLPNKYLKIVKRVKQLHSDAVPFIGKLKLDGVQADFYNWMKGEIR